MSIENEKDVDLNNEEEVEETEEETQEEETTEEPKEEKPQETLEDRRARLKRQLEQTEKKLGIEPTKSEKKSSKKNDLDYGQKAFLIANGIKGEAEMDFTKSELKKFGGDIDSLLENDYFKASLKDFRDKLNTEVATPTGTKRTNQSASSTLDYWLAKGEMPPTSEPELRRAYVNTKLKKEQNKGKFYNS